MSRASPSATTTSTGSSRSSDPCFLGDLLVCCGRRLRLTPLKRATGSASLDGELASVSLPGVCAPGGTCRASAVIGARGGGGGSLDERRPGSRVSRSPAIQSSSLITTSLTSRGCSQLPTKSAVAAGDTC